MAEPGSSFKRALSISSDNESDYDDFENNRSDVSFPPVEKLCVPAKAQAGSGNIPGTGSGTSDFTSNGNTRSQLARTGTDPVESNVFLHDLTSTDIFRESLPSFSIPSCLVDQSVRSKDGQGQRGMPRFFPPTQGHSDDGSCQTLARPEVGQVAGVPRAFHTPALHGASPQAITESGRKVSYHLHARSSPRQLSGYQNYGAVTVEDKGSQEGEAGEEEGEEEGEEKGAEGLRPPHKRRRVDVSTRSIPSRAAARSPPFLDYSVLQANTAQMPTDQKHSATRSTRRPRANPADQWEVSRILGERLIDNKTFFLVEWGPTSEPERNLADVPELVADWRQSQSSRSEANTTRGAFSTGIRKRGRPRKRRLEEN